MKTKTLDLIYSAVLAMDAAIELAQEVGDNELVWGFEYTKNELLDTLPETMREIYETASEVRCLEACGKAGSSACVYS